MTTSSDLKFLIVDDFSTIWHPPCLNPADIDDGRALLNLARARGACSWGQGTESCSQFSAILVARGERLFPRGALGSALGPRLRRGGVSCRVSRLLLVPHFLPVMLDRAAGRRTDQPVVTGHMARNSSHGSAFEASFGTGQPRESRQWRNQGEDDKNFAHD